jgi:hypothetical protein
MRFIRVFTTDLRGLGRRREDPIIADRFAGT